MSNIRAQQWYNSDPPRNLSGYINDKTNRLIGWPMIRQIRIQSRPCQTDLIQPCYDDFQWNNEEKRSFPVGWTNISGEQYRSSIEKAFEYQTGDQFGYLCLYCTTSDLFQWRLCL